LKAGLHTDRGNRELVQAQKALESALQMLEAPEAAEPSLKSDVYRALVLNCESAGNLNGMWKYLGKWLAEYGDNESASFEERRLQAKFARSERPDGADSPAHGAYPN
jgi:hypothetical protein